MTDLPEHGKQRNERDLPSFDHDLPWYATCNIEAAKARGLKYDPQLRAYIDSDGCKILDRFGQELG